MRPKIRKQKSVKGKQALEVSQQAVKILRELKDEEAFYFYENIGKPTGENAKSLSEFLNKINTAKLECLQFHLERKDFQKWIKGTLGDSKLAEMMETITPKNNETLRAKLQGIVQNRLQELKDAFITIEVKEPLTIKK
ncbi:MAG: DUF5752 family protein [Candidatus Bathyarchaeia archaeon]|jgi:hypothetical protein|nr:hypothetical protein [Candidatus Bathyarchaeota archaeon A05DMB-4]MDH7594577.1 DUF5752 family protein [Candidatus Bathyarchaeota archaeon]